MVSLDQESYDGKYVCFWSTDRVGNVGSAVSVEITGLKIRQPLTVYSPNVDGYYGIGSNITISVNFSEVVTVTGKPYLILDTGLVDRNATYANGSGSQILNFTYTVVEGDLASPLNYNSTDSLKLNGSTILDEDSVSVSLDLVGLTNESSLAGNNNLTIDGVKPVVNMGPLVGRSIKNILVTDDDPSITEMWYAIHSSNTCPTSIPQNAVSYKEGVILLFNDPALEGKHLCFYSQDKAGNVGTGVSPAMIGIGRRGPRLD